MGRSLLAVLLMAGTLTACEDPLIILGDLPGFMRIVAGIPDSVGVRFDTTATRTRLTRPSGAAIDDDGNLYFADHASRIFRVSAAGRVDRLLDHNPCFAKTCLGRPQGVVLLDQNTLLVADDMSDKVWRLNIATREFVVFAGTGTHGVAPDGTVATQATLASPTDVGVLPDGCVLIAERNAHKIRVVGSDGLLRTFAGTGTQGQANDGEVAASAPLNLPTALAVSDNAVYVSETGTHTIREIELAGGTIRRVAGTGAAGFSGDGGAAAQAAFNYPAALEVSGNNLFVADQNNDRVRLVNIQAGTVATFAGTGSRVYNGNGRAAAETSLSGPAGLAVSPFGFLYISDGGHHVVWRTPIRVDPN